MKLTPAHRKILLAITSGYSLKSHRYLDGTKLHQLHGLDGSVETVAWEVVEQLQEAGLVDSNKKFPAATYWLTDKGRAQAAGLKEKGS